MNLSGERIAEGIDGSVVVVKVSPYVIRSLGNFVGAWVEVFPEWENPLKSLMAKCSRFFSDEKEVDGNVKVKTPFELPVVGEEVGLLWKLSALARNLRGKEWEDIRKRLGIFKGDQVFVAINELSRVFFDAGGRVEEGAAG